MPPYWNGRHMPVSIGCGVEGSGLYKTCKGLGSEASKARETGVGVKGSGDPVSSSNPKTQKP